MPNYRCILYNPDNKQIHPKQMDVIAENENEAYQYISNSAYGKSGLYTDLNIRELSEKPRNI